jgi:hypothetical protein
MPNLGRIVAPVKNECLGNSKEVKQCQNEPFCQNKETSLYSWSKWSECSSKCGEGSRSRYRKCSTLNFDFPCDGSQMILERSACKSYDCNVPVNNFAVNFLFFLADCIVPNDLMFIVYRLCNIIVRLQH